MRILAVDDNRITLDLLVSLADRLGFDDVSTVSSAETALEMINGAAEVFECLLLDISMPGMDGIELCALVRRLPAYKNTPIIMLTSMTERDYIYRAFKAGATDYATKPFHMTELGARLRLAQELNVTRALQPAKGDASDVGMVELADDVRIDGFANLIPYKALGNYLSELSKAGLAGSHVLAVKIDQIAKIHGRASPQEFSYALSEVADAICGALFTSNHMLAYAGHGNFLIVQSRDANPRAAYLELQVQNFLDEKDTEFDNGDPMDLDVSVGNPIVPPLNSTQPARDIFDRAISRAEGRMSQKRQG